MGGVGQGVGGWLGGVTRLGVLSARVGGGGGCGPKKGGPASVRAALRGSQTSCEQPIGAPPGRIGACEGGVAGQKRKTRAVSPHRTRGAARDLLAWGRPPRDGGEPSRIAQGRGSRSRFPVALLLEGEPEPVALFLEREPEPEARRKRVREELDAALQITLHGPQA